MPRKTIILTFALFVCIVIGMFIYATIVSEELDKKALKINSTHTILFSHFNF